MKCLVAPAWEGESCRTRRRVYPLWIMLLMFALTGCAAKKEPPKERPPVPVNVAMSATKDMPVQVRAIGNVEPFTTVAIKAQVNGQLSRVHFREGQDVRKGDLLFTIDPRPFEAALRQAEAALAKDLAQAAFSREQVRRYGVLLKDGIVTQDQYDQLRANADSFDATAAADRAAADSARLQLAYCSIRSPIDGRTGNLLVQEGNLVKANDVPVLVTINQVTPIYVSFTVPEKEMPEIRKFLSDKKLKVEAVIPHDTQSPESGTISFLDNAVDTATGTIKLKGTFANKDRRLWPGQFVNVILTLTTRRNAVVVPTQAVQTGQQGQFLFVVKPDLTVESRPVTVGLALGDESVIEKGVNAGEKVVTDGQVRLIPGSKVEVKQEPASGVQGTMSSTQKAAHPSDRNR
jgi:membrane fusion protein, multidrug efflux system